MSKVDLWRRFIAAGAKEPGLSDLHLFSRGRLVARVGGRLKPFHFDLAGTESSADVLISAARDLLSDDQKMQLQGKGDVTIRDFIDGTLVRIHLYRERGATALAIRFLQSEVPRLDKLGLPPGIERFAVAPSGLVIFTGPVGSGKSTALHATVRRMDELALERHVRIIESPMEYEHAPEHTIVSRVSVGIRQDANDVGVALLSALRSDVQVIAFGEVLDQATIRAAVDAAYGAGALVILTMHGPSVPSALTRLGEAFAGEQRLLNQLADAFVGGAALRLLPRADGIGRIVAAELVFGTEAVRELIRHGDYRQLRSYEESSDGMQTLEMDLQRLIGTGQITRADAMLAAVRPEALL
jgi:twitching motility protein PilT